MTNNQKLRRELQRHIDKALILARGQKAQTKDIQPDYGDIAAKRFEPFQWSEVITMLEGASFALDHASFLADEREAKDNV